MGPRAKGGIIPHRLFSKDGLPGLLAPLYTPFQLCLMRHPPGIGAHLERSGTFFAQTPMALTAQDIARVAHLARLELAPQEAQHALEQINGFFSIVEAMQAVDTGGVEPLAHPVAAIQDIALRLRDDQMSEPNNREANQHSAPAVERGLFLVPKVIE